MIASLRGLVALSVIAAVLGVMVALDRGGGAAPEDRRLVPGLEVAKVARIEVGGGDGVGSGAATEVVVVRGDGGAWRVESPWAGPADGAAVGDLLGALAAARWERRVGDAGAGGATGGAAGDGDARVVTLGLDGGARVIVRFGREVLGAAQTWTRVGNGAPVLAPSWVAHAVARDAAAFRPAQLVRARPGEMTGVELHGRGVDLVVSGVPAVVHLAAGGAARLRPGAVAPLAEALVALRASSFPAGASASAATGGTAASADLTVRVLGGAAPDELDARGPCPGRAGETLLGGTAGAVCVADAQLDAVVAAARAIAMGSGGGETPGALPMPDAIDPSPLRRGHVVSLHWSTSDTTLTAAGGGFTVRAGGAAVSTAPVAADDDLARGAIDALTAPAAAVEPYAPPSSPTPAAVTARYDDGTVDELAVVATPRGPALARRGEPFALRVAPAALAAARLDVADLRDRTLVTEEPSALTALDVTAGARHGRAARGATLGEWTGDLDGAAVLAAAETIAHLRATRFLAASTVAAGTVAPVAPRATITATFAAPPVAGGKDVQHRIELGATDPHGGCAARVDGQAVVLDDARCAALAALVPR